MDFNAGNVDADGNAEEVEVAHEDCLDPESVFSDLVSDEGVQFLWGADLERDNTILLRYNAGSSEFDSARYFGGVMVATLFAQAIMSIY